MIANVSGAARMRRAWLFIVLALLAATWLVSAPPPAQATRRIAPELLAAIAAQPASPVDLIVRVSGDPAPVAAAVARLGGTTRDRLALINALVVRLPTAAVLPLAATPGVAWLSLDAPLRPAAQIGGAIDYLGAWECYGNASDSYAVAMSDPYSGMYHLRLSGSGAPPTRCEQRIRIQPSTRYQAVAMLKPASPGAAAIFEVTALDALGQPLAGERYTTNMGGSSGYAPVQLSMTSGPQANFISVVVAVEAPGATVLLDSVSLRRQATLDLTINNLLLNPSFEYGLSAGWLCPLGDAATVARGLLNDHELRITATPGETRRCEQVVHVTPGQQYRLSASMRFSATGQAQPVRVGASSGTLGLGEISASSAQNTQQETVISVPAQATSITLYIQTSGGDGLAYVDNVGLKQCTSVNVNSGTCTNVAGSSLVENGGFEYPAMYINTYSSIIGHDHIAPTLDGSGVTVAVVDSGIAPHPDLAGRVLAASTLISGTANTTGAPDEFGHGTHVAGIIAGDGSGSSGIVTGVAPGANLINLKIFGPDGRGTTSDFVKALEWVYQHRQQYNIRVLNLSLISSTSEHYSTNPLSAAMQVLWKQGIVVVVCAGNNGTADTPVELLAPANDPLAITVGAMWDKNTPELSDDLLADYSAFGTITTTTGLQIGKPDLVAPGSRIISLLAGPQARIWQARPYQTTSGFTGAEQYYRMSGTSMAAPIVAAAAAVLLQQEPALTPDQVKYRLVSSARRVYATGLAPVLDPLLPTRSMPGTGAGYVDLYAALTTSTSAAANQGIPLSVRVEHQGHNPGLTWEGTDWSNIAWTALDQSGRGLGGSMQVNVDWEPPQP